MPGPTYGAEILDRYRHPRHVASFDPLDEQVGTAQVGSAALGDVLKLQIRVQGNAIEAACFRAFGGPATIAVGSLASEWLTGRSVQAALNIRSQDFVSALDLPPIKLHCALLAVEAIQAAVADYTDKHQS